MATPFFSSPVLIMSGGLLGRRRRGRGRAEAGGRFGVRPRIVADGPSRRRARPSARSDEHVARELRQALDPAGAGVEQDEVLDPDAGLALEVDPGLDREDRRRRQRRVERRGDPATAARAWRARSRGPARGRTPASARRPRSPVGRASSSVAARTAAPARRRRVASIWRDHRGLGLARRARRPRGRARSARRRTASGSCRCGSRRPGRRSRTGRPAPACDGRVRRRAVRQRRVRADEARRRRTRAPPRRRSASATRGRARARCSVAPGRIDGSSAASARSATAQAAATRSSSAGSLIAAVRLDPALDRDELDVRRGGLEPPPDRVRHERRPRRATRCAPTDASEPGPAPGQVARPVDDPRVRAPRGAPGSCSASRRASDDLVAARRGTGPSARRPSPRRRRGRSRSGSACARGGCRSRRRRPAPRTAPGAAAEPGRPGGAIRLGPAGAIGAVGRGGEVGRLGQARAEVSRSRRGSRVAVLLAGSARARRAVFAKACVPEPSFFARKYR